MTPMKMVEHIFFFFLLQGLYTSNTKTDSSPIIDDFVEFRNQVRQHALSIKSSMHQKVRKPQNFDYVRIVTVYEIV